MDKPDNRTESETGHDARLRRVEEEAVARLARIRLLEEEIERVAAALVARTMVPADSRTGLGVALPPIRHLLRRAKPLLGIRLQLEPYHAPRPLNTPTRYTALQLPPAPPLLSIVTPSYNQAQFLEATMRSVLEQGYPRLEYVVQDGGSTDGSAALLARYGDRLHHAASERDAGQAQAINRGFARTSGAIMAYLNSDDLLLPGALAYVSRYFHDHPDVDVVYGQRALIDGEGREIGRWILPPHRDRDLYYADYVPQETLFWRRQLWEKSGGRIDESFQFAMDWDLIMRFIEAGARIVRVPRFLGAFRVHDAQKTGQQLRTVGALEMNRVRARHFGRPLSGEEIRRGLMQFMVRHAFCRRLYQLGLVRY
jgi:glycosyltransferase involved in cell wall biosynthesis